jgi:hypothetical protein
MFRRAPVDRLKGILFSATPEQKRKYSGSGDGEQYRRLSR